MMFRAFRLMFISALSLLATSYAAQASTFEDALTSAYENNPRIKEQREFLQSTDERVAQAMSGFRPSLSADYQTGGQKTAYNSGASTDSHYTTKTLSLSQPLFRGGGTFSSLNSARQRVKAGQYDLAALEQQVLLDAVTAYMNVVANSSILELAHSNESVLAEQLKAANTRFAVGEVTRTDVAQAQSRLSDAHSSVITAEGQLLSSIATFERVIGYKPQGEFAVPDSFPVLPVSLEEAINQARAANPQFLAAVHTAKSSVYDVYTNESALLPTVSLVGSMSRSDGAGSFGNTQFDQDRLGVQVSIPIYQAGTEYSRVRAAKATARQNDQNSIDVRQSIDEQVTQSWTQLENAIAAIATRNDQVKAAEIALEGVKQEHLFGARTLLDVLDAEQELFAARTNLVRANRDRVVAAFSLTNRLGRLTPETLALKTTPYDAKDHARDVSWQPIGF